jgi:hypothetical protein
MQALSAFCLQDRVLSAGNTKMTQRHIILGRDRRHVETERDKWLAEHPEVELLSQYPPKAEHSLLARIGGRDVPRISIEVEYVYRQPFLKVSAGRAFERKL